MGTLGCFRLVYILPLLLACSLPTFCSAGDPRPCGPDSMQGPLRRLIPQEFAGADFRPACRTHDNCYGRLGSNRAACDKKFRDDMLCACDQSRRPRLCRLTAKVMYKVTAKHGEEAFSIAQQKAAN